MENALPALLLLLLLAGQARAAVANPAIKPLSQRGIIFPKESFDDCFADEEQLVRGSCKLLEDCPDALKRWKLNNVFPKTCYFVKYDQYVCCEIKNTNSNNDTEATTLTPKTDDFTEIRPSEKACEDSKVFRFSIVGGTPAKNGEFPYMAALGWPSHFDGSIFYRCGGALISPTFVLTAAHCINFGGQLPTVVRLGGENLTMDMGEDHAIRRVFTHPGYNDTTSYNDIALLELDDSKPSKRQIVCLWPSSVLAVNELTAIGYGQIQFAGLASKQLLKVGLQHVTKEECQPHYQPEQLADGLADSQICAGDMKGVGDTCQGDSGGPIVMESLRTWYAVGITSLGQGCASGPPSVYTRVSSYIDWIESIVWPKPDVSTQLPTFDLRRSD
ncbi:serine protease snake [Drosophila innubila]|uniref:serine protease snake n=1 Tax=Drosophila innubila TaxID=198719 RepID=UPI00148C4F3C|nr:serine protease snake [Drosophila innubila]